MRHVCANFVPFSGAMLQVANNHSIIKTLNSNINVLTKKEPCDYQSQSSDPLPRPIAMVTNIYIP